MAGIPLLAWFVYKLTTVRRLGTRMPYEGGSKEVLVTDPGEPALPSFQQWDIGSGVAGAAWMASNPRGSVLLLHGWGDYSQRWARQANGFIPTLLEQGFNVYAFDMWGCGHSPGRRGFTDVRQAVDDHLFARRSARRDGLPLFLIGHSLGGLVTITSVLRDQDDVAGVVLLAPAIKYDVGAATRRLLLIGAFLAPTAPLPLPAAKPEQLTRDPEASDRLTKDDLRYSGPLSLLTASGGANVSHANWRVYSKLRVPILAVHGTDDVATDPAGSRELIDMVGSEDRTLHLVSGGVHELLDDLGADETLQAILAWLDVRTKEPGARPGL